MENQMSKRLGAFNREGQITEDQVTDAELTAAVDATDEAAPAAEEGEEVDADGDGHHDETGQFVEGNQEAAATDAEDAGETEA
jgi:hypothetical protein